MKRILAILLSGILVLSLFACASSGAQPAAQETAAPAAEPTAEPVVEFSDAVLEQLIRDAIGIPEGDITIAQAEGVTELDLQLEGGVPVSRVSDLSALRYFTNLTSLNLSWTMYNGGNDVDISPLSGLTKLENLSICCDDVADIGALAGMVNMKDLWIWGNGRISDISALSGMTQMESLWIKGNVISDIGALSGMTNLNTLYMEDNLVTDITPLSGLTKLTKLLLSGNPILDYGPVQGVYPNLQEQDFDLDPDNDVIAFDDPVLEARVREAIGKPEGDLTFADVRNLDGLGIDNDWQESPAEGTQITDITPLKYFVNLNYLGIQFHAISDIRPLSNLTKLNSLNLGGNPVGNIDALSKLTNLTNLTLFNCEASDYSPLKNLTHMKSMMLSYSTFSDLSLLSGMKDLVELDLTQSQVSDLSPLTGMTQLKMLKVRDCPITDYAPLIAIYPNLEETDFDPNTVDIAALTRFPDDEVIVFSDPVLERMVRAAMNMPEGDITFADAKQVTKLDLGIEWQNGEYPPDTQITNIDALKYFVNLKDLGLQFHAITDISALAELTNLGSLGLGGNPVQDITPLSGLTNLGFLTLFNCQASDYSALKNLVNLNTLYIEYSTISDLSCLSGLTNLQTLGLKSTLVTDVSPLAGLTNLKDLSLEGDAITDYSPLKKLYPNLTNKDFEMP